MSCNIIPSTDFVDEFTTSSIANVELIGTSVIGVCHECRSEMIVVIRFPQSFRFHLHHDKLLHRLMLDL